MMGKCGKEMETGFLNNVDVVGRSTIFVSIPSVKSVATIYIRANGSVDPPTAPIERNGNIYTFTDNIYDHIVVARNNIVIDGALYVLQGTAATDSVGIDLTGRHNITIKNTIIRPRDKGILLNFSANNTMIANNLEDNINCIHFHFSSNNTVRGNSLASIGSNGFLLFSIVEY